MPWNKARFHRGWILAGLGCLSVALLTVDASAQAPPWVATPLQPIAVSDAEKDAAPRDSAIGPQQGVVVVIKLDEAPLASYAGGIPGLAATSPSVTGARRLDANSPASQAYLAYLAQRHAQFATLLAQQVPGAVVTSELTVVVGGVVASIPTGSIKQVQRLPGVEMVLLDEVLQLTTDSTPQFIGATDVWDELGGPESAGDGVVVGVLDTGVWPEHPSYADPDPAGNPYAPPPVAPGPGSCDFGDAGWNANDDPFTCNNKLIVARRFMATYDALFGIEPEEFSSARDDNGHGTHTSTTAAGNGAVEASIFSIDRGEISGIAPRAHVAAYKVCGDAGCFGTDSAAAIQQAILDGVDVINFSISGGNNPYGDLVELAFLDAYNANVFVAASAGNAGPTADTTDHRGPWVATVAASTSDRHFVSDLTLEADGGATLSLQGSSVTTGLADATEVFLPVGNEACNLPFAAGSLANKVVVCQRISGARILKSFNASVGGAAGMILLNVTSAQLLDEFTDNHYVPTVHIDTFEGAALLAFLGSHTGTTAAFSESVASPAQSDRITAFSSRGGSGQSLGVSKPDIAAPGLQILAGNTPDGATVLSGPEGELFQSIAGTSMASPHIAGSAALLRALHPDWTPGQIKSALMTTANRDVIKQDGDTPASTFDTGSGRVDLSGAGDPGITFDASGADYLLHEDDLWNANYPSVYIPVLAGQVTIERTAKSVAEHTQAWNLTPRDVPGDVTITVSPNVIQLAPGEEKTFTVTIDASNVAFGEVREARIELKAGNQFASIPVTFVRRNPALTLTKTCTPAIIYRTANRTPTTTSCTITATNNTFDAAPVSIVDDVPKDLRVEAASVTGATVSGNLVTFDEVLPGAEPADVAIGPGSSPAGGYLPLSAFGIPPIGGVGDETLTNFSVPAFSFAGETWTQIGVSSNGYAVVGPASGADSSFQNTSFPNPQRPNNVLAPFWTDLDPGTGGSIRVATLTDGADTWIVIDWEAVREYSNGANVHSFQIWIGIDGDANPSEDVSFAYGAQTGNGDGGFATVGAENRFGNRGEVEYFNGAGTLPVNGTQLRVTTTPPAAGGTHVITFSARAQSRADVVNYAEMTSPAVAGSVVASAPISIR